MVNSKDKIIFEDDDKTQKATNKWNQGEHQNLHIWRSNNFIAVVEESYILPDPDWVGKLQIGWIWWDGLLIYNLIADNQTLYLIKT